MAKRVDVSGHTAKRKGKTVTVKGHTRKIKYASAIVSSCINNVKQDENGEKFITVRGTDYPYPDLPKNRVSGLLSAKSAGRYYNKNIRGKYF